MNVVAHTWHVAYGEPPTIYAITCELGGDRQIQISAEGGMRQARLVWRGKHYRPGSRKMLAAVIEGFLQHEQRQAERASTLDEANRRLAIAGTFPGTRQPPKKSATTARDLHELQLPVADRA